MSGTAGGALGGKCAGAPPTHQAGAYYRALIMFSKFLTARSLRLGAYDESKSRSCITASASHRQEMNIG